MMKIILMLLVAIWVKPGTAISGTCPFTQFEAEVGHTVTLPCCFNVSLENLSFVWERHGTKDPVHAYRSGKDHLAPQDKQFRNRTTLIYEDLSRVISLQILSVQLNDSGIYCCAVPELEGPGSEMPLQCVTLIVANTTKFRPDTTRSPEEDEMTKSVRNTTEFRPNTTRSPEKDEATKSEVKNTDVHIIVWVCLLVAGLLVAGLGVLLKWRKSCWRKLKESQDANIYEMETLKPSAPGDQNHNIRNDPGHIEQQVN